MQNMSLRPNLARLLTTLPPGVTDPPPQPGLPLVHLSPAAAGWLIKAVMITLALAVAWKFRSPVSRRDDLTIAWECATISLAMLLYSPITWGQHCVGALPALYLLVRTGFSRRRLPALAWGALSAFVVLVLLLNRGLIGRTATLSLLAFGANTWCLLALLAATVSMRNRAAETGEACEDPQLLRRAA
jgi:hypothetical protein